MALKIKSEEIIELQHNTRVQEVILASLSDTMSLITEQLVSKQLNTGTLQSTYADRSN